MVTDLQPEAQKERTYLLNELLAIKQQLYQKMLTLKIQKVTGQDQGEVSDAEEDQF